MSFFDTISRIIQQGKEMAVKATPSSKQTYNKVTPVNNSQFTSNPLLRTQPMQYQKPVIQQPTFNVPVKAQIPQARTAVAETTPMRSNETMAQTVSQIIQGGKEAVKLGGGVVKDVARGTARGSVAGGTFVGARLLGADVNQANQAQFQPKTRLDKFLFGDQPASIQSEGIAPLESLGISTDKANKFGAPFVLGSIALDAFTGGSSKAAKNALQKVASNMTAEDATILRNLYAKPTAKNVMPVARNEQAIITALKLDKLPYTEQKTAVDNILKEYDKRWGGVDEALNPPVKPNRAGAMDVKKPNVLDGEAKKYTGKEVNFVYNSKKADLGKQDFAQDVEPAGQYMNIGADEFPGGVGMVKGKVTFKKPLILDWKTSRTGGWKTELSQKYNGKTGKELSQAIIDDGYDGVIALTKDAKGQSYPKEAVNLQTFNAKIDLLEQEAKKYKSAEEFANSIRTAKNGVTSINTNLPVDMLDTQGPLWKFEPGRKIKEPVLTVYDSKKNTYTIVDGHHRFSQALANKDKTIPSRLVFIDSNGNPEQLTRTQLTDIYNKAHAKPAPVNKKLEAFRSGKTSSESGHIRNPLAKAPEKSVVGELKAGDTIIENNGNSMEFMQKMQTPKGKMYAFKTKGQPDGSFELFAESEIDELLKKQNLLVDANIKAKAKKVTEALQEDLIKQNLLKQRTSVKIKEAEVDSFLTTLETGDRLNATKSLKRLVSNNGQVVKEYEAIDAFLQKGDVRIEELRQTRGAKKGQLVKALVLNDGRAYPLDSKSLSAYAEFKLKKAIVPNETKLEEASSLETIKKSPANNQVVSSGNDSIRLSPIDRLIADNKIRVVSRDGRDVYQVKKGGEWVSKRDEDSAIRAVTPRSPIDVIKTPRTPKITRTEAQYRVTPEQIKDYDSKLTALSGAEAGERVVKNNPDGTFGGYVAKKSTFPSYIDEDLRSRKLFDRYMDGRQGTAEDFSITYPKGSKLDRIDKIIKSRIGVKEIKVRQMSRSRDVARLEQEATDRVIREQKRVERQTSPAFRSVLDEPTQLNKERVAQLEKAAMPTADVVRPSTPYKVDSLANVITKTPLDRKVNIIDYLRTPDRVLNKIGFGKEAKLLREQYEKYSVELPKNIDKISEWVKRVPKDASERIFQHLDGKAVKLSATEQKVADEIRAYLKDWADRLGLPEENRVANYITRLFDDQLIKQEFDEDLAKIISGKIPGEVYNPFLQKRLGAKGYKQDVWGALDAYTKRATRKVHLDPALDRIREKAGSSLDFTQLEESQFKYIQRYIDRVQMRPTEVDNAIDNAVKQTLGYRFGQRPVTNVSRFLRRMTYRGMLGANLGSALRNLSQGVNTYAVLGEKYTAIGYAKLLQPASQRELIEQGIFNNNFIEDRVLSSTRKLLQKGDKALWFFFDRAEKINRGSAYLGAKAKGLGKGMSEQEAIDYAKNIVRKTQFSYDAVDQPVALGSDIMKTLFQFQTYTTKQTEFLTEMIKDKNVVGLLRYAIGGYLFVNTVGKALGMSESELIPLWDTITGERKFSPAPALKFPIELTKAIADTPDKYGNERDFEQKAKDVGKSLIGLIPGGNQIKKTVEGMQANAEGGSFTKAGVKQFEVGQSPAAKLQTVLFGKYANQNAKDYFNKTTTTGDKELDKVIKDQKKADKTTTNKVTAKATQMMLFTKEEQAEQLKEIAKVDRDFAMKVRDKLREENKKKSWSDVDKGIAQLGVENGSRANFVYKKMRELPAEERNAYIKGLHDRKVISDEVLKQIKELHKKSKENNDIIQ